MLITLTVGICGLALLFYTPLAFQVARYSIPTSGVISAFALSLFSVSIYFDWIMMADNSERYILRSNLLYIVLYAIALLVLRYLIHDSSIMMLLVAILIVKVFQTIVQFYWMRSALFCRSTGL